MSSERTSEPRRYLNSTTANRKANHGHNQKAQGVGAGNLKEEKMPIEHIVLREKKAKESLLGIPRYNFGGIGNNRRP